MTSTAIVTHAAAAAGQMDAIFDRNPISDALRTPGRTKP